MKLWRIKEFEFEQFFEMPLCEYREINEIFSGRIGQELNGWAIQLEAEYSFYNDEYGEVVYAWDQTAQNYVVISPHRSRLSRQETNASGQGNSETDVNFGATLMTDAELFQAVSNAHDLYRRENTLQAVELLADAVEVSAPDVNPIVLNAARYWHAFLLEMLGRHEEALAEYVTIYETAPNSSWGKLAALHLEPIGH